MGHIAHGSWLNIENSILTHQLVIPSWIWPLYDSNWRALCIVESTVLLWGKLIDWCHNMLLCGVIILQSTDPPQPTMARRWVCENVCHFRCVLDQVIYGLPWMTILVTHEAICQWFALVKLFTPLPDKQYIVIFLDLSVILMIWSGHRCPHTMTTQLRKIAVCACAGKAGNVFPHHRLQRKPLISDPGMHVSIA